MSRWNWIGVSVPRLDGLQKVTGEFLFLEDRGRPKGLLYGRLITSPVANGIVHGFRTEKAKGIGDLVRIFTPMDDPMRTPYNSSVYLDDQQDLRDERIFTDRPLFLGDPVGAVLAETPEGALRAAQAVEVLVQELPPVLTPLKEGVPSPLPKKPRFIEGRIACGEDPPPMEGTVEIAVTVRTPKVHHGAMENHICLSYMDGPVLTVESPCQMPFTVRHALSKALGLPMSRIRVIKAPMGGSFGGKQEVFLETRCALMTLLTGRPVLLKTSRRESIISTRSRAAVEGTVRMRALPDGTLLSRSVEVLCDSGAYATGGHRITMAMGKKTFRLYRIPRQEFVGRTYFTNTVPSGACRGYGSPQIHAITEIALDLLARKLHMDPAELRLKNLVHPFDLDPTGAPPLGNARVRDCLEEGLRAFRWEERKRHILGSRGDGRFKTGIGLACCTHGNGYYGSPFADVMGMTISLCEDGSVLVNGAFEELGNGTMTAMTQIVADAMDLPLERVFVAEADTHLTPFDVGCVASRVTHVCGACALEAALKLRSRIARAFLALNGIGQDRADQVVFQDGVVSMDGLSMSYGSLASRSTKELGDILWENVIFKPQGNPASYAVHFAQVEVDTLTGLVRVTDYLACHDVGRAINPMMVKGQIYGGVQMGIGLALMEEIRYDKRGVPLNGSFSRYHMPNGPEMPDIKVMLVERGEEGGPFGAKSVGEIATVPVAPAICNAVNMAVGTKMTELPFTPERIVGALRSRGDGD
ncbi:aerobic-type carbon monoxide dehydrogenase, large subunit CoxL/CutL-like protein [Thermanaerovibrio velox DSM 12556]|uniref:Aerobic-type carbon monoxide dehydrogenase, large subunit CoxL/CutL-like protein n=1 Tax=Thermanaerovibrio velox DSM 12556 TaxID=926567 RepID=H0UQM0_9BACT|nr:molybdopterin cofactor-binding domain-containing protein [Thermanaerovibrio velox]EHM10784.1 aerobic-type carbon monoxide dehydrogenase, large subunit CoxL/CutL-like protein [Thermanaerovibrio velox DSM 12556]